MDLTNLVLAVVLSACSDVSRNLELPLPLPLTTNHVSGFRIHSTYPHLHASVLLTNGAAFSYERGQIWTYTCGQASRFWGTQGGVSGTTDRPPLGKVWALEYCRARVSALGYDLERLYMDTEPEIRALPRPGYFSLRWYDPTSEDTAVVRMEVDSAQRLITDMWLFGALGIPRPEPDIAGLAKARSAAESAYLAQTPAARKEQLFADDPRLTEPLSAIGEFAERLGLPLGRGVGTNQVRFPCEINYRWLYPRLAVQTTNGMRFAYDLEKKRVVGFDDGKPFFSPGYVRWRDYVGQCRINEAEAIRLVRAAAARVGWKVDDLMRKPPDLRKPNLRSTNVVARYSLNWDQGRGGILQKALYAEVDADGGRLVVLGFEDYTD